MNIDDIKDFNFISEEQLEFLKEGNYLVGEETVEERFKSIANVVRKYEHLYGEGLGDRIEKLLFKGILCASTPTISNAGREKESGKSIPLPASCNIVTVDDSIEGIYFAQAEVAMLSKNGAGVGSDYTLVCQKGTKLSEGFFSNSKLDWIESSVDTASKVSQGATRRGYNTPFISIEDNDFYELMSRVSKKNANKNDVLINNTVGIVLPSDFYDRLPNEPELQKRYIVMLTERMATGKVYVSFVKNMNENCSPVYKKLGLNICATNICSEFIQPLFTDMTSVCVIGALNLNFWDLIKTNPQIIKDAIAFLDIMNEEYVQLAKNNLFLSKAHKAAKDKRDIGLGTLGFHDYLQSKMVAFGSLESMALNEEIYSTIRKYAEEATTELGEKIGSPKICQEAGMVRRNASLMMVAPNKSTSFIYGATSLGIEPFMSNIFTKTIAKIESVSKNKHLIKLLEEKVKNTRDVWKSIEQNNGSVQHLDFLSQEEKNVFKTMSEISPKDIIDLASQRQKYLDMGQSLNLVKRKNYTLQDVADIHKYAYEKGIKTLYYMYSSAHAVLEKDGEKWDSCSSCAD